jgi:dCTP deaminase
MSQGILSGPAIEEAIQAGRIFIEGYDPRRVNPASYDLTLGEKVAIYRAGTKFRPNDDYTHQGGAEDGSNFTPNETLLDAREDACVDRYRIDPVKGWVLKPGIGYLMHTAERVRTDHYVPVLDGKSSLGRLFVQVHVTAGYGDPGFDGQYTLEVVVTHAIRVYPGMPFCQIRFHTISGKVRLYTGRYKGAQAVGAIPADTSGLKS